MLKDDYSVGSNIRDIREQLGISKVCLARRIGIHRNAVAKVESGERKLNQKGLKVFARALGVSVQDILAGI